MRSKEIMVEQCKAAEILRISGVALFEYGDYLSHFKQHQCQFTIEQQDLSIILTEDCKTKYKVVNVQHDYCCKEYLVFTVILINKLPNIYEKQFRIHQRDFLHIFSIKSSNQPYFRLLSVIGREYAMNNYPLGIIWIKKMEELKGIINRNNIIKPFKTKSIIVRETVRFFGANAFSDTENITFVVIPPSVETIGRFAFNNCKNLQKVTFKGNSKLRKIGSSAFEKTSISSFNIPASVVEIGYGAFCVCKKLKTFTFQPNSKLKHIGSFIISDSNVESIEIPSSVEEIYEKSFENIETLKSVTFPLNSILRKIGKSAFSFTNIKSIEIPASVEVIDHGAFAVCKDLIVVTFAKESKLRIIGSFAFTSTSIISIRIPASVEEIREYAFSDCLNFHGIMYEEGSKLKRVSFLAFCNTPMSKNSSCECY